MIILEHRELYIRSFHRFNIYLTNLLRFLHVWQQSFILARYNAFIVQWELNVFSCFYTSTLMLLVLYL